MTQKAKPATQVRPFTTRAQHFAAVQQGIINHIAEGDAARKVVRDLLRLAVRAGAAQ